MSEFNRSAVVRSTLNLADPQLLAGEELKEGPPKDSRCPQKSQGEDGQNLEDSEQLEREVTHSNTHVSGRLYATPLWDTSRFTRFHIRQISDPSVYLTHTRRLKCNAV